MSDAPIPGCSCRVAWLATVIALVVALASVVLPRPFSPQDTTPHPSPSTGAAPAASQHPSLTTTNDARLAETTAELVYVRRVLDDAQSALAQRDREIATANDELRVLRQELESLRAKTPATAP